MTEIDRSKTMETNGITEEEFNKANDHVVRNRISARKGRRCVDGRYQVATEDSGTIARPGGDAGYVEVMLALNNKLDLGLTPTECVDIVYTAISEVTQGGSFFMHSDEHTEHEGGLSGCGHLAKPTIPEKALAYEVKPEEVKDAIEYMKETSESGKYKIKIVNLPGEHQEQGVLVVNSKDLTINPSDRDSMYFVYDAARDEDFMNELVKEMNLKSVDFGTFKEMSDIQLNATLSNLALNMPIFSVDFSSVPIVNPKGRVKS